MKCVWLCLHWVCVIRLISSLSAQLSYRVVSLCNHFSRSLVKRVLAQDESLVGAFLTWEEEKSQSYCAVIFAVLHGCTAQQDSSGLEWETRGDHGIICVFNAAVCSVTVAGILCCRESW